MVRTRSGGSSNCSRIGTGTNSNSDATSTPCTVARRRHSTPTKRCSGTWNDTSALPQSNLGLTNGGNARSCTSRSVQCAPSRLLARRSAVSMAWQHCAMTSRQLGTMRVPPAAEGDDEAAATTASPAAAPAATPVAARATLTAKPLKWCETVKACTHLLFSNRTCSPFLRLRASAQCIIASVARRLRSSGGSATRRCAVPSMRREYVMSRRMGTKRRCTMVLCARLTPPPLPSSVPARLACSEASSTCSSAWSRDRRATRLGTVSSCTLKSSTVCSAGPTPRHHCNARSS
mmetsp:Transcript_3938/g.14637  ORF Transcript_3938/g.14637 Transcript_3938/m.14637 type:complete len:290 (-) Transcript_3938:1811-2680(-)